MSKTKKTNRLLGRVVAMLLTVAMVLSGTGFTAITSKAATGPVATPINSIKYDITVSGVADETELSWTSQDNNWGGGNATVPITGDGDYSFTATYSSATGLKNVGFFATSDNENLAITVNKMTVNDTYEIPLDVTLRPGVEDENGTKSYNALKNIWSGFSDGDVVYGDASVAYFGYDASNELIIFYVIGEVEEGGATGPVATALNSIKYDITVSGVADETELSWTSQDNNWGGGNATVPINGNGDYSFTATYSSATGLKNVGFFATSDNENLAITVNKMTVNDTYEIPLDVTLRPGVEDEEGAKSYNALKNIWGGFSDGDVVYGDAAVAYFGYDASNELIVFYVISSTEEPSLDPAATEITSIEYIGTVGGATGAGSFEWITVTTSGGWGQQQDTVNYSGNGAIDFTVDLSDKSGAILNLGYLGEDKNSTITVTINQIIINEYYTLNLINPATLAEASGDGLANRWSLSEDTVIAQDALGCASLNFDWDYETNEDGTVNSLATINLYAYPVSQYYVLSMGDGWNLGNSFDGVNTAEDEEDLGEEAWGNPVVTKELIQAVKDKGYDSIRIPMTLYRRYSEVDGKYVIDTDWLARYKEVVDYATSIGLHVMINIHHDSWLWLSNWDGNVASDEYVRFTELWEQLAAYFADESYLVSFETINEPAFSDTAANTAQQKLDIINKAAYDIIRNSGGNNDKRIIIMPTLNTDYSKSTDLYNLISSLDDPYVVATFHYYSEWVFSANLGRTGFEEDLFGAGNYTPKDSIDTVFSTVYNTFTKKGIGVVVGEYGLLGYDAGEQTNQAGEELKYYEYANYVGKQKGFCLMFWDNGSGINRTAADYSWKKPLVGEMLEAGMRNERSSYATGLDTIYLSEETQEDISVPLTLNGNTFVSIADENGALTQGTDYNYNADTATITLTQSYVNGRYASLDEDAYGQFAELTITFSSGAAWHEYLVKYGTPEFTDVQVNEVETEDGVEENGIKIIADYKGADVRRVTAYQASGKVGPNSSWWSWLQKDGAYTTTEDTLKLLSEFFNDASVTAGALRLDVEMYDGQMIQVNLVINEDGTVTLSNSDTEIDVSGISASDIIMLYEGETEIPAQYLNVPEGAAIYGGYSNDSTLCALSGWPQTMSFAQTASEKTTIIGLAVYCWDQIVYIDNITFGVKKAPVVANATVAAKGTTKVAVNNLATDAVCKYAIKDTGVATVDSNGVITGVAKGTTTIEVTVTQYNRTDVFTANVTVTDEAVSPVVAAKGTILKDTASNAKYEVTSAASSSVHTVAYVENMATTSKTITVPSKVTINGVTYQVTSIAPTAFKNNKTVTSISIANSVKSIGKSAFYGCSKLQTVTFASGSALTTIGENAFYKCTALTKITIPSKVKTINQSAFYGCSKLKTVTFATGSALTTIGDKAFYLCKALTKITVPAKVKKIGQQAFRGCSGLTTVAFAKGSVLTTIGSKAFYQCTALTRITIPSKVKMINQQTFYGCSKLKTVTFASGSEMSIIGSKAFYRCTALTKITIPSKVKRIDSQAFYGCSRLATVIISTKKLTSTNVGANAFAKINYKAVIKIPSAKLASYTKILKKKGITGKSQSFKKF